MRKKKQNIKGRESCRASSVWGIKTDKHAEGRTSGWQQYHTQTVGTEKCLWQTRDEPRPNV